LSTLIFCICLIIINKLLLPAFLDGVTLLAGLVLLLIRHLLVFELVLMINHACRAAVVSRTTDFIGSHMTVLS
jgi:hypothetical protein